jgi:hypothetical protein
VTEMAIGKRIKLTHRGSPLVRAKRGDVGTVEDLSAGGIVYVRFDSSPNKLQELNPILDEFVVVEVEA